MKKTLAIAASLALASCATPGTPSAASRQAEFDQACKYVHGVTAATVAVLPVAQQLLLAKFGQEAADALAGAFQTAQIICDTPLDVNKSADLVQRIYDAGGALVALVVKSQAGAGAP